jgi:hypothetical protein
MTDKYDGYLSMTIGAIITTVMVWGVIWVGVIAIAVHFIRKFW